MIDDPVLDGTGAVYLRVSTDKQESTRQRCIVEEWLSRHSVAVDAVHWYEDLGWARDEADQRPEFQRMLRSAEHRHIQWIVVDMLDRFGTKNKHQFIAYIYRLQEAGCRLYTVDDKEWTKEDLITLLEAAFAAEKSEGELRDKSERVLEGMRQRAEQGMWVGGRIPYGVDVVAFRVTPHGLHEQWRVQLANKDLRVKISPNGSLREYTGKNNFPATEEDEYLQLRPTTEAGKLDVVRFIFQTYVDEAISPNAIARRLNKQGVQPPACADFWTDKHISYMLTNPTYIGMPPWNRSTIGKYTMFSGGKRVRKKVGTKRAKQKPEDWILPKEAIFSPIIELNVWERTQAKVKAQPDRGHRNPRSAAFWLAGLVYCGNCGSKMHGAAMQSGAARHPTYFCSLAASWRGRKSECPCKMYRVRQGVLETYLNDYLDEALPLVQTFTSHTVFNKHPKDARYRETLQGIVRNSEEIVNRVIPLLPPGGDAAHEEAMLKLTPEHIDKHGLLASLPMTPQQLGENLGLLIEIYQMVYEFERMGLQDRLAMLEAEHTKLVVGWADLPSERAKEKAKVRLQELEMEMGKIERDLHNASDELRQSFADFHELNQQWSKAVEAMQVDVSARQKAAALAQVIEKIVVTFEPTGRRTPLGRVKNIEIVAKVGTKEGFSKCESEFPRK